LTLPFSESDLGYTKQLQKDTKIKTHAAIVSIIVKRKKFDASNLPLRETLLE